MKIPVAPARPWFLTPSGMLTPRIKQSWAYIPFNSRVTLRQGHGREMLGRLKEKGRRVLPLLETCTKRGELLAIGTLMQPDLRSILKLRTKHACN